MRGRVLKARGLSGKKERSLICTLKRGETRGGVNGTRDGRDQLLY